MTEIPYNLYKVANIEDVEDSKKVAGAIFFDDTTRCIYVYGAGGVIKRYGARVDEDGSVWANGIIDDNGLMYAFPGSSQEIKDNADFILQEKIEDLDDIREEVNKIDGINELVNDFNSDISYLYQNKQDKVYVLDFTLQDIYDVYYNGARKQCSGRATLEALQSGRQIVIKYDEGTSGTIPVAAYVEDALYINIVYGTETIMVEIYAYHEALTGVYQENVYIETITNPIIETPDFLNNESLLGLPFGYVGGTYGSYLVDTTEGTQNIDFGLLEGYYYGNVAIYWYGRLYQFAVADLRGSGQNIGTAIIQLSEDDHLLGTFYVGGLKKIFSWRTFTNRYLLPTDWIDGDLEGRINDNTSAIESLQTNTVQKTGDIMTGTLTAPKFIGELEGNATSADVAKELSGHIEATEESFIFRASAGNKSIKDENARIEKIQGSSVVWNQGAPVSIQTSFNGVTTTMNDEGVFELSGILTNEGFQVCTTAKVVATHIYLHIVEVLSLGNLSTINFGNLNEYEARFNFTTPSIKYKIYKRNSNAGKCFIGGSMPAGTNMTGVKCRYRIHDLTQMFGAGKEPTTVEEFYDRLPKGVDLNAYNEGEIINGNYGGIKTTGYNQFNGTYAKVLGGYEYHLGGTYTSLGFATTEDGEVESIELPSDGLYTPSQNGYIFAQGENIDIHLNWSEYNHLNEDYHPYKPFERDLSWLMRYFPATINGETKYAMRQAGSVRDEARLNSTTQKWEAVQRVGVRAYTSGDENDSILITDGTNTNYPLASVTPVEITENVNFDFDVSDYGTEELIAGDGGVSAPLVAGIVYEPNVLATIKNQSDIFKRLAALEAQFASLVSASAVSNE